MKTSTALAFLSLALCYTSTVQADTFGSGSNAFDIEFVSIGSPGNPADTTGSPDPAGSIAYQYRIGKYEVADTMINKANALGNLGITHDNRGGNRPATSVNWFEVAQFVNWLNTSRGHSPAYKFNNGFFEVWRPEDPGYDSTNIFRNSHAFYFLPSNDEWYKAAYYDSTAGVYYDYPTGRDTPPNSIRAGTAVSTAVYDHSVSDGPMIVTLAGGLSPYGTMAQGGNVYEWMESAGSLGNHENSTFRVIRGGAWKHIAVYLRSTQQAGLLATFGRNDVGFRVASKIIPEPTTLTLAAFALLSLAWRRRR